MADTLVIVVSYNGMRWIERCVGSVLGSAHEADLMVIDNSSTDGTAEWLESQSRQAGFFFRKAGGNIGFGAANNIGMRFALERDYSYVYLLNQDAWLMPDTLKNLISALKDSEGCGWGVISPVQTQADGISLDKNFAKHCGLALNGKVPVVGVRFVMAAHWLITRECLEKTGGFSPAFKLYGEDDDYINRARYHGFGIGVVPSAKAIHDRGERPYDKQRRMKLKLVGCRSKVCNPEYPFLTSFIFQILKLAGMSLKNMSMMPIRFIPQFTREYGTLKKFHDTAKEEGAFIMLR